MGIDDILVIKYCEIKDSANVYRPFFECNNPKCIPIIVLKFAN